MLKIEPREANKWQVPSPEMLAQHREHLLTVRPEVVALLEAGDRDRATALVDKVLLRDGLDMNEEDLETLTRGRAMLKARRVARSKGAR